MDGVMADDERPYIICARIEDLPVPHAPARSDMCVICGHDIWLGFAVLLDVPDGRPICYQCALLTIPPDETVVVPPEVRREVAEILRRRRQN